MSNQYFNFYYSPIRQGFDSGTWRTLYGEPTISSNRLDLQSSAIIHYGDILRGDATISLITAAPAPILSRRFGFWEPNKNAYAYFNISGANFTAECSDGLGHTTTVAITWQSAWTGVSTEFRVKWEAGRAEFFVGGVQQAVISDASVSGDPMSLYLSNDSVDIVSLNYITVKGIQSYMMSEGNDNSVFEDLVSEFDRINVSESVTMLIPTLFAGQGSMQSDGVTISENVNVDKNISHITTNDNLTVTDVPTVDTPA